VADLALLCHHDEFLSSSFARNAINQCVELLSSILEIDSATILEFMWRTRGQGPPERVQE
jgi:hypothetical protein